MATIGYVTNAPFN
jgi:hypothetical protein